MFGFLLRRLAVLIPTFIGVSIIAFSFIRLLPGDPVALLSGERQGIAAPWMKGKGPEVYVNMRREPQSTSGIIARLEPGVVIKIGECNGDWCHAEAGSTGGWVSQAEIWGAYPGEAFK